MRLSAPATPLSGSPFAGSEVLPHGQCAPTSGLAPGAIRLASILDCQRTCPRSHADSTSSHAHNKERVAESSLGLPPAQPAPTSKTIRRILVLSSFPRLPWYEKVRLAVGGFPQPRQERNIVVVNSSPVANFCGVYATPDGVQNFVCRAVSPARRRKSR
jgi:hypothetical protein